MAKISKKERVIFYLATMMYWFSMYTYVPILSPYVEYLGGSLFMVGLVVGSYGFTQMLVRIPLGIWSDKLGNRKIFILIGILCALTSSLGLALSSNVWLVLFFRALAGVAASSWVAFTVLFAGYFEQNEAPKAMGIISFYTSLGQMAATTLGGYLAEFYGWESPFYVGAIIGVLGLIIGLKITEQASKTKEKKPVEVRDLVSVGKERLLLTVSILAILGQCVTFTTMFGFTPLHAVNIGASKSDLSILILLSTLPNAIAGYLSGGFFVRKIGERFTVMLGFLLAGLCTITLPFIGSFPLLVFTQAINGFAQGLVFPVLMGLAIKPFLGDKRATAMGFFQAIYSLGMFGGPFLAGTIGEWVGLAGGFYTAGAISLFGLVLAKQWIPEKEKLIVHQSIGEKDTGWNKTKITNSNSKQ